MRQPATPRVWVRRRRLQASSRPRYIRQSPTVIPRIGLGTLSRAAVRFLPLVRPR